MSPVPLPWGADVALPAWPPAIGLTTIKCPLNQSVFSFYASTHIDAPVDIIWNTLRNSTAFSEWNTFTPSATVTTQPREATLPQDKQGFFFPGTSFTYIVVLDSRAPQNTSTSDEVVFDDSTPHHPSSYVPASILKNSGSFYPDLGGVWRISWGTDPKSDIGKQGLVTERFNEIIPLDGHKGKKKGCEYRTWEDQCGPPAQYIKALQPLLQEDFGIWARDLKKESEKKVQQRREGHGKYDDEDDD